jgi:predicted peptidase
MKLYFLVLCSCSFLLTLSHARTWTSADGRTVEADFVSATDTEVTIRTNNGKSFTLKLDQVSQEDREFVTTKLATATAPPADESSGKYNELATGNWEKSKHNDLEYRFYAEPKLRRSKTTQFPLVIYLHGRGGKVMEREDFPDHSSKTFSNPENYKKRPCFILVPQAAGNEPWSGNQGNNVLDLISDLIKELPIDKNRIYITGYSMGGYGTWWALGKEPKRFAAGIPIAGGGNPSTTSVMQKIPIWAFHGAKDEVVPVEQTRKMVEALEKRGIIKYTEIPDKGHDVWNVYQDEKVHEWLFEQSKAK